MQIACKRLRRVHTSYGHAKAHRLVFPVLDHDAHVKVRELPALALAIDVPPAVHQQVRGKNAAARKIDQQPFSARLDAVDRLPSERRVVVEAREQRISGAEARDGFACQRASQVARGAKNRIAFGHSLLHLGPVRFGMRDRQQDAPQMHAERAGMKSSIHEKPRHEVRGHRLAVDRRDQHALMAVGPHPLLAARTQKMRQARGCLRALRFFSRAKKRAGSDCRAAAMPLIRHCAKSPQRKRRA